jgi:hypothetical protein
VAIGFYAIMFNIKGRDTGSIQAGSDHAGLSPERLFEFCPQENSCGIMNIAGEVLIEPQGRLSIETPVCRLQ